MTNKQRSDKLTQPTAAPKQPNTQTGAGNKKLEGPNRPAT